MIDGDIKNACENSEMICIGLRNDPADDYLVGCFHSLWEP